MIRTNSLYVETPLVLSEPITRTLGTNVYLKLESLQPSRSFKNRGIGNYCRRSVEEGAKEFVSSSGGNAGLAAAYAARQLSTPITVVVPDSTPQMMIDKIREQEATVMQHGRDWQEADAHAKVLYRTRKAHYVSPFDHPYIWEGNATMIHEVAKSGLKPDVIVVAVGGGGLFCGVVQGLHDRRWDDVPVYAVETEGAASFARAKECGEVVEIDAIKTVAKSLGARAVSKKAVEWAKIHPVYSKVVTDKAAIHATKQFSEDHGILIEPACGAALSLCYEKDEELKKYENILVIVCGGAAVTPELIEQWTKGANDGNIQTSETIGACSRDRSGSHGKQSRCCE